MAFLLISSCAQEVTPSEKAEKFLFAMSAGDLETAKVMVDEASESVIITLEKARVEVDGKNQKIIIVDEETNGERAVVKYRYENDDQVQVIRLHDSGEDWEVMIDGDSEDIIIGKESLRKVLQEVDLTVEQALALSADAVEQALNVAGKTMEEVGKALIEASEDISIHFEGSEEDIEKAKAEIKDAIKELEEALDKNKQ